MSKVIQNLYAFFIPDKYRKDEQVFRKARIFVNTLWITFVFSVFYIGNTIEFQMPHIMWEISVLCFIYIILIFLFKNGLSLDISGLILSALYLLSTIYDIYFTGGIQSPIFPWLVITPIITLLITNIKYATILLSLAVICAILIGILQNSGVVFPLEIDKNKFATLIISSHAGLILIVFAITAVLEKAYLSSFQKLEEKNKIIQEEKERSDELLLNILPAEVVEELKETGKTKAKNYDLVTVLFADIVDFTSLIEEMPPEELVSGIDDYFKMIDSIVTKFNIEKIKTVGDAYICAAGLGTNNSNNPVQMLYAALEIIETVQLINQKRKAENKICFELRIGIHSGPLVAGVVGVKKFAYDIWGDTVNTAARMQQHGEPGKINISGTTRELVKHRFNCFYRGRMEAKHKGLIDMYFVESKKIAAEV